MSFLFPKKLYCIFPPLVDFVQCRLYQPLQIHVTMTHNQRLLFDVNYSYYFIGYFYHRYNRLAPGYLRPTLQNHVFNVDLPLTAAILLVNRCLLRFTFTHSMSYPYNSFGFLNFAVYYNIIHYIFYATHSTLCTRIWFIFSVFVCTESSKPSFLACPPKYFDFVLLVHSVLRLSTALDTYAGGSSYNLVIGISR